MKKIMLYVCGLSMAVPLGAAGGMEAMYASQGSQFFERPASLLQSYEGQVQGKQLCVKKIVDEGLDLIDIKKVNPRILVDIVYATQNNVAGERLYSSAVCYLRKEVAIALDALQKELETVGLGLKIWDGFRPVDVQAACYAKFPKFFAQPVEKRMKHNRGTAVDLTLVDQEGNEVLMPTGFDALVDQARHEYRGADILEEAIQNREVLKSLMAKYGFCALAHEWWHYDFWNWKSYDVIYLSFEEIEKRLAAQQ